MPAEITLEIKIKGNDKDLNKCHPYCNYLKAVQEHGSVLCRLFRTEGYLKPDHSGFSVEFYRCAGCIDAQVEARTWKQPLVEATSPEQTKLLMQGRIDQQDKYISELQEQLQQVAENCAQMAENGNQDEARQELARQIRAVYQLPKA